MDNGTPTSALFIFSLLEAHMAKKLFVGNLPFSATEEDLTELFAAYGEVHSVKIINDRETGRPRGFGFVEMENADQAIAGLNDKDFQGRPLRVNESIEREGGSRGGSGGGSRGGFGGGGGGGGRGGDRGGDRDSRRW